MSGDTKRGTCTVVIWSSFPTRRRRGRVWGLCNIPTYERAADGWRCVFHHGVPSNAGFLLVES